MKSGFYKIANLCGHYLRQIIYFVWKLKTLKVEKPNLEEKIDVIIPVIEKDLDILPLCISGVRENVTNRIKDIFVVGPAAVSICDFAKKNGLIFIEESAILGYTPISLNLITKGGINRSGWLFQQLLKLSGKIGTCKYFLVIDSDHILLKPHTFLTSNLKTVFYQSSEFHFQYYKMNKKLVRVFKIPLLSFVSHKMLFEKDELFRLTALIEQNDELMRTWDKVIFGTLDKEEASPFSEFEFYGCFSRNENKILHPWNQKALTRTHLDELSNLKTKYHRFWSVTFPSYLQ